ncbi:MAG: patatin-like phospholipase family protein, partial [Myxococcales bacterium]|nr:patatin-like phospholipase family protein [Myxococcales bacterium]
MSGGPLTHAQWLAREPFTLMLGAGFFGFFSHAGFLQALEAADLRPRRVVGCSAGALAGGLWASGIEADALAHELRSLRRQEFWDPGLPLGGLLKGRKFNRELRRVLARSGVEHVHECPIPFTAIVHDVVRRRCVALDRGRLDLAIQASCTVPLMFRPVWVDGRLLVDGGVSDRAGTSAVASHERTLLHYLPPRRRALGTRRSAAPPEAPGRRLTVVTPDLPRVSPFRLDQGPVALERRGHPHVGAERSGHEDPSLPLDQPGTRDRQPWVPRRGIAGDHHVAGLCRLEGAARHVYELDRLGHGPQLPRGLAIATAHGGDELLEDGRRLVLVRNQANRDEAQLGQRHRRGPQQAARADAEDLLAAHPLQGGH